MPAQERSISGRRHYDDNDNDDQSRYHELYEGVCAPVFFLFFIPLFPPFPFFPFPFHSFSSIAKQLLKPARNCLKEHRKLPGVERGVGGKRDTAATASAFLA